MLKKLFSGGAALGLAVLSGETHVAEAFLKLVRTAFIISLSHRQTGFVLPEMGHRARACLQQKCCWFHVPPRSFADENLPAQFSQNARPGSRGMRASLGPVVWCLGGTATNVANVKNKKTEEERGIFYSIALQLFSCSMHGLCFRSRVPFTVVGRRGRITAVATDYNFRPLVSLGVVAFSYQESRQR